jgi:hypothetical protein
MISQTFTAVNSDPRAWLEHFPANRRSTIANWFHYAVRGGATTPAAVVHQVYQTVQRRLQWASAAASALIDRLTRERGRL